jgi:poly(A) polymerase
MPMTQTGTPPNHDEARTFAGDVVGRLRDAGFLALWAGGCVRDIVLGLRPSDYDVATDARPEQVMNVFPRRTLPLGESFGVVRVQGPRGSGMEVEVATFRSDGAYVDGRRPESVAFSSPRLDAERRDFTINGMFFDPSTNEVIDYVGGRADLDQKIVRAIGDPSARFREDKLRLIRAVRFAARFHFALDPATRSAIEVMAHQIVVVAAERIAQELRKMLEDPTRAEAMALMMDTGLMATVFPPVAAMKGLAHELPVLPDGDLWDHVLRVLASLPERSSFPLALAGLLHEVGITGAQEDRTAREIVDDLCRRLKLANAERERVLWLVESLGLLMDAERLPRSRLKRLLAAPGIDDLLALHRADALASTGDTSHVEFCENYLRTEPDGPIDPPPLLTGHDLAELGLRPGPKFKSILEDARDKQLERVIETKSEAIAWVIARVKREEP